MRCLTCEQRIAGKHYICEASRWYLWGFGLVKNNLGALQGRRGLRLGMCLSRCSLRVKLFPQYAQKTMVPRLDQQVRQ